VIQHSLDMADDYVIGASGPGRAEHYPFRLIRSERLQQGRSAGGSRCCPEDCKNVTSFHVFCPVRQCINQMVILLVAQCTRGLLVLIRKRREDCRDLPGLFGRNH